MVCSPALPSASPAILSIPSFSKLDTAHNLPIKQSGGTRHPRRLPSWLLPICGAGCSCVANMPFEPCGAGVFSLNYFHISPSFYLGHCDHSELEFFPSCLSEHHSIFFFLLFLNYFLKLFILCWNITDQRCCDSSRWHSGTTQSYIYMCPFSPKLPSIQAAM